MRMPLPVPPALSFVAVPPVAAAAQKFAAPPGAAPRLTGQPVGSDPYYYTTPRALDRVVSCHPTSPPVPPRSEGRDLPLRSEVSGCPVAEGRRLNPAAVTPPRGTAESRYSEASYRSHAPLESRYYVEGAQSLSQTERGLADLDMHSFEFDGKSPYTRGERRKLPEGEMGLESRNGGFPHHGPQRSAWVGRPDDRGERYRRERLEDDDFDRRPYASARPAYKQTGGPVQQRSPSYSPDRRARGRSGGREHAGWSYHAANGGRLPGAPPQRHLEGDRYQSKDPFHGSGYSSQSRDAGVPGRRPFLAENHRRGSCHPCAFYAVGRCRNGEECRNCHDEEHSDPRSPLFALDVLHRKGLCIVCIDFKKKGMCDDPDRAHGMLYCHHPQHCSSTGDYAEERRDNAAYSSGSGTRRAPADHSPKIRRPGGDWGDSHVSSGRCRQREDDYEDYSGRESARRRLQSPERSSRGYGSSARPDSGVSGGSKYMSPGKEDYCGRERGPGGGGSGVRTASLGLSRGVQPSNSRMHPPRACEERRCVPCAVFFAEGRCRQTDCSRCHEPCHGTASSSLFYQRVLHEMNRCEPCRAFADGCCPVNEAVCRFCHDPSHAGDRLPVLKSPSAPYYVSRRGPYEANPGRSAGGSSYRGGREDDSLRRREPLGGGRGGGADVGSRVAAGGDSDRSYPSRGPRVQRVERGGAAYGGAHPERCVPCLWYFQHVTGCGKGRSCTGCHHEDHRDPQSDLHPSKRLHVLGRCVPCRNHFKGICPRQAEACGFCHHEDHGNVVGSKDDGRAGEEERKEGTERKEHDGSRSHETRSSESGGQATECSVDARGNKEGEGCRAPATSELGEKAGGGETGGTGGSPDSREDKLTEKESGKEGDSKSARNATKTAVSYVRQRGQNEPRAHERGVCRPCAFYFIGPQGCLKRERCPDCHHADHANPHSSAHPSKLLHLKGTCRPCIPFQRGNCQKTPENCVYCHHSSHLDEVSQDRELGDRHADAVEENEQIDATEFPVQDLDDDPSCCQEDHPESSPSQQLSPGDSRHSSRRGGELGEAPPNGDQGKSGSSDGSEVGRVTEYTGVSLDQVKRPEQDAGDAKGNTGGEDASVADQSCPLDGPPRPYGDASQDPAVEEGAKDKSA
ncbi:conserved hypothetical protein [Neospora caninum Liverpool]|uniref:C3H1-type domain-containing protein n=1 Tax=Neospora caninum (strain Liverpool) TaxID=572307 RepID=F0VK85_NEOCL|nr:conserved hypothetical protein [Neospora caninum Liverpool]CBZ54486.1 conserved hypothetical protein [Neospora caninum Liverpool]CEL69199.1 TPA: hypothetical protein BN1204_049150 [Neospora caninum Liverpool]|eukprot:XP_003884516.1 conserved hypothetical protein [Neospora caninum Liverpool]